MPTEQPKSEHEQVQAHHQRRTVVITGAVSGIGRALAQRLSAHSCPVVIADVDEKGLKETDASLSGPTLVRVLDVRDAEAQRDFAAQVREWAPQPIGAVFNNAGVAVASSVLDSIPEERRRPPAARPTVARRPAGHGIHCRASTAHGCPPQALCAR